MKKINIMSRHGFGTKGYIMNAVAILLGLFISLVLTGKLLNTIGGSYFGNQIYGIKQWFYLIPMSIFTIAFVAEILVTALVVGNLWADFMRWLDKKYSR